MIIFFILHILFLIMYAGFIAALIWHYREYTLPSDPWRWLIGTFFAIAVILAVASTILFFMIPWDKFLK